MAQRVAGWGSADIMIFAQNAIDPGVVEDTACSCQMKEKSAGRNSLHPHKRLYVKHCLAALQRCMQSLRRPLAERERERERQTAFSQTSSTRECLVQL